MKTLFWLLVIVLNNLVWLFRSKIRAWLQRKDPLAAANDAIKK